VPVEGVAGRPAGPWKSASFEKLRQPWNIRVSVGIPHCADHGSLEAGQLEVVGIGAVGY